MLKTTLMVSGAALAALALPGMAHAAILGPDAAACRAGAKAAAIVKVDGFKQRTGNLRVQVYPGDRDAFLAKGAWISRIDLPVSRSAGPMEVCVALPRAGDYAIAVRHDVDGSGKSGWSDGGGFSRNPKLSLLNLKPKYDDVVVALGGAVRTIPVVLNYRQGLSIGPVGGSR